MSGASADPYLRNALQPIGEWTYVVLDLVGPAAAEVRQVRRRLGYDYSGALPVEITVAGSSGIGTIAPDQPTEDVFAILDSIANETPVISTRFGPVLRFPDTDIFVLTMEHPEPFIELHERIKHSDIDFLPSPFPFTPHCTLRGPAFGACSSDEARNLIAVSISDEFQAPVLSTYTVEGFPILKLRHRSHLKTPTPAR